MLQTTSDRSQMRKITVKARSLALVIALVALTGCATTSKSDHTTAKPVPTHSAAAQPSSPAASSPAKSGGPVPFGTPWTYKDGLTVIVMDAKPYTSHPSFEPKPGMVVTLQVQNKTDKAIDPYFNVNVTSGAAGQTANMDIDSSQGILGFEAPIPPGGTATAKYGFTDVVDPAVLTVTVVPGYDYQPAFFKS